MIALRPNRGRSAVWTGRGAGSRFRVHEGWRSIGLFSCPRTSTTCSQSGSNGLFSSIRIDIELGIETGTTYIESAVHSGERVIFPRLEATKLGKHFGCKEPIRHCAATPDPLQFFVVENSSFGLVLVLPDPLGVRQHA